MSLQRKKAKRASVKGRGAKRGAKPEFLYQKQFTAPDGKRVTFRLGNIPTNEAEEINKHIEVLRSARRCNVRPRDETMVWLRDADKKLVRSLVKHGLCEPVVDDPFVVDYFEAYVARRKVGWAERTIINFEQLIRLIRERFAKKRMAEVTREDARMFWTWLREKKGLGENTAKRKFGRTREVFAEAVDDGRLSSNPFKIKSISIAVGAGYKSYIDEATIQKVIDHCPSTEWKLLFAFARYVGCRIPSEIEQLTWGDVNFEKGSILLKSPKTRRYGKGERLVPIFPEVQELLSRQFEEAEEGQVYVFGRLRSHTNLSTTARRYVKAAGIIDWPSFWNSLRASRETDLMDKVGPNKSCQWIGNSLQVASKHYQLMKKESYSGRQNAGISLTEGYLNPNQKSDVKSDAVPIGIEQNRAAKKAANPGNYGIYGPNSTPNRTRTCD